MQNPRIGLIDYGAGNLHSVAKVISRLGAEVVLLDSGELLAAQQNQIDALVLPGVGAFAASKNALIERNLWGKINDWLSAERAFLGICLGYQMLFSRSFEHSSAGESGLDFFQGEVVAFPTDKKAKSPHMGWNNLQFATGAKTDSLFGEMTDPACFYFVHSYYPQAQNPTEIIANCEHGEVVFPAAMRRGKVIGAQFHPEKSQQLGLIFWQNFLNELCE